MMKPIIAFATCMTCMVLFGDYKSVLPLDSFGVHTIGSHADLSAKVDWRNRGHGTGSNSEYVTMIDGVEFKIFTCPGCGCKNREKGSFVASIDVSPVKEFESKEAALPFYEKFRRMVEQAGFSAMNNSTTTPFDDKYRRSIHYVSRGNVDVDNNCKIKSWIIDHNPKCWYNWWSLSDPNVEMGAFLEQTKEGGWSPQLRLKDFGMSSEQFSCTNECISVWW